MGFLHGLRLVPPKGDPAVGEAFVGSPYTPDVASWKREGLTGRQRFQGPKDSRGQDHGV